MQAKMERIHGGNDEKLYQPKIHAERIRKQYLIDQETGLPMTVILDRALHYYIEGYELQKNNNGSEASAAMNNSTHIFDHRSDL
jgi:hypothetical protein